MIPLIHSRAVQTNKRLLELYRKRTPLTASEWEYLRAIEAAATSNSRED